MYVCLCMGVSDGEIKDAIREGACSVHEVMECTGAGTGCGSCRSTIHELVSRSTPSSGRRSLPLIEHAGEALSSSPSAA
jgi:bacterioferritin-associated ferredoxin